MILVRFCMHPLVVSLSSGREEQWVEKGMARRGMAWEGVRDILGAATAAPHW